MQDPVPNILVVRRGDLGLIEKLVENLDFAPI